MQQKVFDCFRLRESILVPDRISSMRPLVFAGIETMGALIFDFDGVIADSEAIANTVLAEIVTGLGHATTLDQSLEHYSGRRWNEVIAEIEAAIGTTLPENFSGEVTSATLERV